MQVTPIEAIDDHRVREYVGLTDAELRRGVEGTGGRDGQGLFIVEGVLAINVLLARRGWALRSVLVTEKKLAELDAASLTATGAPVYVADQRVLNAVVGFDLHRGAVAAVDRPSDLGVAGVVEPATTLVMIEGLNDQENLGVIFRNAAALGADGVLLSPNCCDPLYRRTVRVSMGHVLTVPFARTGPWPEAVTSVGGAGFTTVALTPDPTAAPIEELGTLGDKVAVLLGSEGPGLTEGAMAAAHQRARIAMRLGVDSLNVSNAAAIAFHRLFAHRLAEDRP